MITKKTIPREKTQYLCDFCGYKTERKAYLEIHQRRHTNERPFKCDTCGKSFSSKAVLTDHIMHHSTLEKVFCDVCHKGFKRQSYLKVIIINRYTISVCMYTVINSFIEIFIL